MVAEKMAKFHQQLPAYLKQHREKEIPILWNKINTFLSLFSNRNQEKLCTPIKIDARYITFLRMRNMPYAILI